MNVQVNKVVLWAVNIADKYHVGVQGVIDNYLVAYEQLGDSKEAMAFIESELKRWGKHGSNSKK